MLEGQAFGTITILFFFSDLRSARIEASCSLNLNPKSLFYGQCKATSPDLTLHGGLHRE